MLDSLLFLNYFNSRLCTRGDIDFNTHLPCKRYFNSRLYTRGDAKKLNNSSKMMHFNSRLYMRGNISEETAQAVEQLFQFTPLHERQPGQVNKIVSYKLISIHAST